MRDQANGPDAACPPRIARRYIVWVLGCSPLIRMSSRKRWRNGGTYRSAISPSCHQIEKVPIVRQVRQFAKPTPLTSARNTSNKRQYRESGFVHLPSENPTDLEELSEPT